MIIPEVQLKRYIDSLLRVIQELCRKNNSNCIIEQIFQDEDVVGGESLGNYSFKEQAMNLFVEKTAGSPEKIQTRIAFDPTRAALPTIHITTPSEDNVDRSLGEDPEPTGDGYNVANNFRATYECIITGQNTLEVITIYRVLQSLVVGTMETLQFMGFYSPVITGGDLHIASEAVPQGIFARSIRIQASYENKFPSLPTFKQVVNQIVFTGKINWEAVEAEMKPVEVSRDDVDTLTIRVVQLDTNPAYAKYDVQVIASGGTTPYTGVGIFEKDTGTYTFEIEDADGTKVSEEFTVRASDTNGKYQIYANNVDGDLPSGQYKFSTGLWLQSGNYYINWGDGTDSLVTMPTNTWVRLYDDHIYDSPGLKGIEVVKISGDQEIPMGEFRIYDSIIDFEYFTYMALPTKFWLPQTPRVYGDIAIFKQDTEAVPRFKLYFACYENYNTNVYGDIINLKNMDVESLRFAVNDIFGNVTELINQGIDEIYFSLQVGDKFTIDPINPLYTADKSIKYARIYSAVFNDEETTNFFLQVAQNQVYVGGTVNLTGNAPGKLDLTDPTVLAEYNKLLGMGWTISIPTY
jgi:hypothetical protein